MGFTPPQRRAAGHHPRQPQHSPRREPLISTTPPATRQATQATENVTGASASREAAIAAVATLGTRPAQALPADGTTRSASRSPTGTP